MWGAIAGILGSLLGGAGRRQANERTNQNDFQQRQNQLGLSQYGIQQNALLQALLAGDRGAMDRYSTQQGATTNALNSGSQEATSRYGIQQGATQNALGQQSAEGLQRAQLGLQAPNVRARQSILGSLMQNMQPVTVEPSPNVRGHVPKISGGLTPAALDPMTRQHGGELMKAALQAQLSGSDVPTATNFRGGVMQAPAPTDFRSGVLQPPPSTDYTRGLIEPPAMTGYQQPGRLESILSLLSSLLSGASGIGAAAGRAPVNYPIDPVGGG